MSITVQKSHAINDFRGDINGLRAWAVLAVLLFHFNIPGFSGGFAGVDIFFVISGYLMASIICRGVDSNKFSLWSFYLARARRILPALIIVVIAVLVFGWFMLVPTDYKKLGTHARDSLFFTSNLRYLAEAGYFDQESHRKWLLHTWSLSVEWQFYLIYPIILTGLHRALGAKTRLATHIALLLISLGYCVFWTQTHPEKAFYWLPSRAWELLSGSCIFILSTRTKLTSTQGKIAEWIGMTGIIGTIAFVDSSMSWPGGYALLPVVGASLILLAGRQYSLLTHPPIFQWVGLRSYSIYLWHWPLVAALAYFELQEDLRWVAVSIFISLLAGHLSFHFVEVPSRVWLSGQPKIKATGVIFVFLSVVVVGAMLIRRNGIPERLPANIQIIDAERKNRDPRLKECLDPKARCTYGGNNIRAMVLGDSHANSVITAITEALPGENDGVLFRGASACLFVFDAKVHSARSDACHELRETLRSQLPTLHPGIPIILVNRTSAFAFGEHNPKDPAYGKPKVYFTDQYKKPTPQFLDEFSINYIKSVCELSRYHPVYLLRPIPEMPVNVPNTVSKELMAGRIADIKLPLVDYTKRHSYVWSLQNEAVNKCGVKILDPTVHLCDQNYCYGMEDNLPIYSDDDHINERGNKKLIPMFSKVFKQH